MFARCAGTGKAKETAIGFLPTADAIDLKGLEGEVSAADLDEHAGFRRDLRNDFRRRRITGLRAVKVNEMENLAARFPESLRNGHRIIGINGFLCVVALQQTDGTAFG